MATFNPINKYATCAPTCHRLCCQKARPNVSDKYASLTPTGYARWKCMASFKQICRLRTNLSLTVL